MVVPLGPGKFYGSSLPRPRFYNDVKFNTERVDPPLPFNDPLLSWAEKAHWSMGGLSFNRIRLQGKIEGNVEKLRKYRDNYTGSPQKGLSSDEEGAENDSPVSPPPAPRVLKRKRIVDRVESDEDEAEVVVVKKKPVRKLVAEFDRVAKEMEANKNAAPKTDDAEELSPVRAAFKNAQKSAEEDFNTRTKKNITSKHGVVRALRVSPRFAKSQ